MILTPLAFTLPQLDGPLSGPLGQMLVVLTAVAVITLVGWLSFKIAWRLVTIVAIVVGTLLLLSPFGINVL